jgi:hypothetical protein
VLERGNITQGELDEILQLSAEHASSPEALPSGAHHYVGLEFPPHVLGLDHAKEQRIKKISSP